MFLSIVLKMAMFLQSVILLYLLFDVINLFKYDKLFLFIIIGWYVVYTIFYIIYLRKRKNIIKKVYIPKYTPLRKNPVFVIMNVIIIGFTLFTIGLAIKEGGDLGSATLLAGGVLASILLIFFDSIYISSNKKNKKAVEDNKKN